MARPVLLLFLFVHISVNEANDPNVCASDDMTKQCRSLNDQISGSPIPDGPATVHVEGEGTYIGNMKNGKYHGYGKYLYSNGDIYEGIYYLNYNH
jgi:hypothetical protein